MSEVLDDTFVKNLSTDRAGAHRGTTLLWHSKSFVEFFIVITTDDYVDYV